MRSTIFPRSYPRRSNRNQALGQLVAVLTAAIFCTQQWAYAQTFDSGSDGSDGALNFVTPGTVDFDPAALGLDVDGDNIFHFTTITIGPGVTLRLTKKHISGPVFWLATGTVQIDGTIDLSGGDGQNGQDLPNGGARIPSVPGAGGFSGGIGAVDGVFSSAAQPGSGPGKGLTVASRGGGGGGNGSQGEDSTSDDGFLGFCELQGGGGGQAYGNPFIVPSVGGSGGAGGDLFESANGGGGGAGGGALMIASSTLISVNGTILADGGKGGDSEGYGAGGGSGGAIRLAAPAIDGGGTISAKGGARGTGRQRVCPNAGSAFIRGHGGAGAIGRIRREAFDDQFAGSSDPATVLASPFALFLPDTPPSMLLVTSVAGIPLVNPMASFTPADIQIDTTGSVAVQVEARNIPTMSGDPSEPTIVQLHVVSENTSDQIVDSTPLSGTPALSTATVDVTFPSGFSRAYVRAIWNPSVP